MLQEGEGERPSVYDEENEDLCKTCHRSFAWQVMMEALDERRRFQDEVARDLDALAQRVENNELNDVGVVKELRARAEALRQTPQDVSKTTAKPSLRLVANGS